MTTRSVAALVVALSGCSGSGDDVGALPHAGDASVDGPVDALVCPVTPDEVITTPLLSGVGTATFTGFLICPADDKDTFAVELTADAQNLELQVESTPTEATVAGTVLNKDFTPIMNAAPIATMPLVRRAYLPNQPRGRLFIHAYAATPGIGHYNLTVTVTNPN